MKRRNNREHLLLRRGRCSSLTMAVLFSLQFYPTTNIGAHAWFFSRTKHTHSHNNNKSPFATTASFGGILAKQQALQKNVSSTATSSVLTTTTASSSIPQWQQALPHPLNERITLKRIIIPLQQQQQGGKTPRVVLYLLGTSHVSNQSCRDAQLLLETIQPNIVFLELCDARLNMLFASENEEQQQNDASNKTLVSKNTTTTTTTTVQQQKDEKQPPFWERVRMMQENVGMSKTSAMSAVLLIQVQDDYADTLGVELGGEFRVAWEHCFNRYLKQEQKSLLSKHRQAQKDDFLWLILGDRPLFCTLFRAWESLSLWNKIRLLAVLTFSAIFRRKPNPEEMRQWIQSILTKGDSDVLTESLADLRKYFPSLARVILQERDAFMAAKVIQTCRHVLQYHQHYSSLQQQQARRQRRMVQHENEHDSDSNNEEDVNADYTMVAIVGAGHVEGITSWLTNGNGQSPEQVLAGIVETSKADPNNVHAMIHHVQQVPLDHVAAIRNNVQN